MLRATLVAGLLGLLPGAAGARDCPAGRSIGAVREAVANSRITDEPIRVTGIVTGRFPGEHRLNGFFLQQDQEGGVPAGIFVYTPEHDQAEIPRHGTRVSVRAQAGEHRGSPQLEWVRTIRPCGRGEPEAVAIAPPLAPQRLDKLEGVLVRLDRELVVTGNHQLDRWGVLQLAAGGRLFHEATGVEGGREAGIVLDDGSYESQPQAAAYRDAEHGRRVGSRLTAAEGVLVKRFNQWRLHPVTEPVFRTTNPRRSPRERPEDALRLATLNLNNFFPITGARGPSDKALRQRREAGIVKALAAMDADVLAVQELANNPAAARELRRRLNAATRDDYRFALGTGRVGDDAIRVALLVRDGGLTVVDAGVIPGHAHNRPPVWARLEGSADSRSLTTVAVHFKSRGGCGAGGVCGRERRRAQARSVASWLRDDASGPTFVLGDFNSYTQERPLQALARARLIPIVEPALPVEQRYTYVHRARSGMLDFILANESARELPSEGHVWHMGADEARGFATTGPWGASDHDPVMLDVLPR